MKISQQTRTGVLAVLCAVFVLAGAWFILTATKPAPSRVNGERIVEAVHAYAMNLQQQAIAAPASVSLDDLIAQGFLKAEDVSGLAGMKTLVYLPPYDETQPQKVLMEANLPDGHRMYVLADGSVQSPRQ